MEQNKVLRIVIADDEAVIRMGLKQMIGALGHHVVGTAVNGDEALEVTTRLTPDLLLLDIKMPDKDGLAVAEILTRQMPLPIVMLTAYSDRALIERATNAAVMGYLVKPIHESKLGPSIELAVSRFEAMRTVAQQVDKLRGQLAAHDIVNDAKRILIAGGLSEEEAYKRLQFMARNKRCSMRQIAEAVIAIGQ
jgi:response regulator NasT